MRVRLCGVRPGRRAVFFLSPEGGLGRSPGARLVCLVRVVAASRVFSKSRLFLPFLASYPYTSHALVSWRDAARREVYVLFACLSAARAGSGLARPYTSHASVSWRDTARREVYVLFACLHERQPTTYTSHASVSWRDTARWEVYVP